MAGLSAGSRAYVFATYECLSAVRSAANLGQQQTLQFEVSAFDPPTLRVEKSRRFSRNGQRYASILKARYREGRIETPWILPVDLPHWREFYESVQADERFVISALAITGVGESFECFIPDDSLKLPRRGFLRAFQTGFNYRIVNDDL